MMMLRRLTQMLSITAVWAMFVFVPGPLPDQDTGGSMQSAARYEAAADIADVA
jgi:hypothetical protein